MKNPEYVRPNTKFVFREGRTKAVGTVLSLVEGALSYQSNMRRNKRSEKKMERGLGEDGKVEEVPQVSKGNMGRK